MKICQHRSHDPNICYPYDRGQFFKLCLGSSRSTDLIRHGSEALQGQDVDKEEEQIFKAAAFQLGAARSAVVLCIALLLAVGCADMTWHDMNHDSKMIEGENSPTHASFKNPSLTSIPIIFQASQTTWALQSKATDQIRVFKNHVGCKRNGDVDSLLCFRPSKSRLPGPKSSHLQIRGKLFKKPDCSDAKQ